MRVFATLALIIGAYLAAACSAETAQLAPDAPASAADIPDVRCPDAPSLPGRELRHTKSKLIVEMGEPRHRGIDVIAAQSDETQTLTGALAYSDADKALEDEDVELFACTGPGWRSLGTARTDGDGRFTLALTGADRMPVGLRDVYGAVADGTGMWFLAFVAPDGSRVMVSDIDGTLTSKENSFPYSLAVGTQVGVQPGAPAAFVDAAAKGITPIFITARGDLYTQATRQWLADKGFPRAPLHLAQPIVTLPGNATVAFKQAIVTPLVARFDVAGAIGNRASDISAYGDAGVSADRIFIKLPEFGEELAAPLAAHQAVSFTSYDALRTETIVRW